MTFLDGARLRSKLPLLAAMILPLAASAEVICALGPGANAYNPASDQRPSADTMQLVRRVDSLFMPFCAPQCPAAAMLRNDTAANLMLTANQDGGKLIYAPQFFANVYGKFGEPALVALIAHVYGHAIDETVPSNWIPTAWDRELRADAWAGCALAKGSLSASDLASALAGLAAYPPISQSAWTKRAPALRLGFTHCGGVTSQFDTASSTATKPK